MRRWFLLAAMCTLLVTYDATAAGKHAVRASASAAEAALLTAFVDVYNSQAAPDLSAFIREHYAASLLGTPAAADAATIRWLRAYSLVGPVAVRHVERDASGALKVWTRGRITRTWLAFSFGVRDGRLREHAIFSTARPSGLDPVQPPLEPSKLPAYLQEYVHGIAAADAFSGVVALVRSGEVIWTYAAGFPDDRARNPVDADTKFDLASVSKMFVAVAALQLREEGLLEFDAPISAYLPDYPLHIGRQVSVSSLLSHTTGLRLQDDETLYARLFRARTFAEQFRLQTDALAAAHAAGFTPLGEYRYSNEGIDLVAAAIEAVTKTPYEDYVRKRIFEPAGMTRTHPYRYGRDADVAVGLTRQHPPSATFVPGPRRGNQPFLYAAGRPAGGFATSANDMAKFVTALSDGRLLSKTSWNAMTTPRALQQQTDDFELHYGWGADIYSYARGPVIGHGGGRPGASTRVDIFHTHDLSLIVLSNYDYIAHRIAEHVQELLMVGRY